MGSQRSNSIGISTRPKRFHRVTMAIYGTCFIFVGVYHGTDTWNQGLFGEALFLPPLVIMLGVVSVLHGLRHRIWITDDALVQQGIFFKRTLRFSEVTSAESAWNQVTLKVGMFRWISVSKEVEDRKEFAACV